MEEESRYLRNRIEKSNSHGHIQLPRKHQGNTGGDHRAEKAIADGFGNAALLALHGIVIPLFADRQ
jgi:hypothetical protein